MVPPVQSVSVISLVFLSFLISIVHPGLLFGITVVIPDGMRRRIPTVGIFFSLGTPTVNICSDAIPTWLGFTITWANAGTVNSTSPADVLILIVKSFFRRMFVMQGFFTIFIFYCQCEEDKHN